MTSNAVSAQGTLLKRGDGGSPEVFTDVSEVNNFQGPDGQRTVIDVTTLSSTAKEKRAGLKDWKQFAFDINYVPGDTNHNALLSDLDDTDPRNWKLVYSNGVTVSFSAILTGFSGTGQVDGVYKAKVTLEISGDVSIA